MIAIVDYGVGNLYSLGSSLQRLGLPCVVTGDADEIMAADKLILPGVGAFGDAMDKLRVNGVDKAVKVYASTGKPLLGICVGMQLLFEVGHEFGRHEGLGLLEGEICPMEPDLRAAGFTYKVPHIGWNPLDIKRESPLLAGVKKSDAVYYVHSYYAKGCEAATVATSEYGVEIVGAVQKGNVFGTQFHPEKSGSVGLGILKAFGGMGG